MFKLRKSGYINVEGQGFVPIGRFGGHEKYMHTDQSGIRCGQSSGVVCPPVLEQLGGAPVHGLECPGTAMGRQFLTVSAAEIELSEHTDGAGASTEPSWGVDYLFCMTPSAREKEGRTLKEKNNVSKKIEKALVKKREHSRSQLTCKRKELKLERSGDGVKASGQQGFRWEKNIRT